MILLSLALFTKNSSRWWLEGIKSQIEINTVNLPFDVIDKTFSQDHSVR